MRIGSICVIALVGCQHPALIQANPPLDCNALFSSAARGWQDPADSLLLSSRVGFWRLTLSRPTANTQVSGLATLWTGYSQHPRELIGSHGVSLRSLGFHPSEHDGSLQLWQIRGDTVGMHIGSPLQGQGVGLYAVGAGTSSLTGCWFQMGPDSTKVKGFFRLDPDDGPAT